MNRHRAFGFLMALLFAADTLAVAAPEETTARDRKESEETTSLAEAELPNWRFWKGKTDLKLETNSVLRWTNPEIGRVYGNVYVWTSDGRPEIVMSLLKSWKPADDLHAEIQSLSLEPLEAK